MKKDNYKHINQLIGEIIYEKRKYGYNYSQARLAELTNMDANNISRIERGETAPALFSFLKLCAVLEVDVTVHLHDLCAAIRQAEAGSDHD